MSALAARWRPVVAATLGILLGAFAIAQTPDMSELGRVFPMTSGLIAIAAGLGVLLQTLLRPAQSAPGGGGDLWRALALAGILLLWALLLRPVGFVPTSAIALPCVALVARREPMSVRSILTHAGAAVILVLGFAFLLSDVLNVRLP